MTPTTGPGPRAGTGPGLEPGTGLDPGTGRDSGFGAGAGSVLGSAQLVDIANLRVQYRIDARTTVEAVRGVDLALGEGECLALVGESGSGKSSIGRALLGLAGEHARVAADQFRLLDRDAADFDERTWRSVRGREIGLVLQDALIALDPLRRIGDEIAEAVYAHRSVPRAQVRGRVRELLELVHMPEPDMRARQYPHELSGGQRQRALIAAGLAGDPRILVADEPTASLDVTVQAALLDLFAELKERGTAILLISHDLGVVARLADRVAVLRDGVAVETGSVGEILANPQHPYTKALLHAVPRIDADRAPMTSLNTEPTDVASAETGSPETASDGTGSGQSPSPAVDLVDPADPLETPPILAAVRIGRSFRTPDGGLRAAVREVDFGVRAGESVGVAGESGSGKTTLVRLLLGLLAPDPGPDGGGLRVDGLAWERLSARERRAVRSGIQWVPQDPLGSFDPGHTVGRILAEALSVAGVPRRERPQRADALLEQVGLGPEYRRRRPIELSGGQRQRTAIARALAPRPRVLLCDEPVSALDVTVQAQVLDLLDRLRAESGLALVFVSHDLAVIRRLCERVVILADGRVVEQGPTAQVLDAPAHPVTRALVEAVPRLTR